MFLESPPKTLLCFLLHIPSQGKSSSSLHALVDQHVFSVANPWSSQDPKTDSVGWLPPGCNDPNVVQHSYSSSVTGLHNRVPW